MSVINSQMPTTGLVFAPADYIVNKFSLSIGGVEIKLALEFYTPHFSFFDKASTSADYFVPVVPSQPLDCFPFLIKSGVTNT